jgi:hypothetical protein
MFVGYGDDRELTDLRRLQPSGHQVFVKVLRVSEAGDPLQDAVAGLKARATSHQMRASCRDDDTIAAFVERGLREAGFASTGSPTAKPASRRPSDGAHASPSSI